MLRTALFVIFGILICSIPEGLAEVLKHNVVIDKLTSQARLKGVIKGDTTRDYMIDAQKGQSLKVTLKTSNRSSYFNITKANANEAIFVGSISGNDAEIEIPDDGTYIVRVYLMRNAARRNEKANYSLDLKMRTSRTSDSKPDKRAFEKKLKLQGISFSVIGTANKTGTHLSIRPEGLKVDNKAIERSIDGEIIDAEVADLNADGSPEIYIYTRSLDSKSTGGLVAYSANNLKSLSEIHLPSLTDNKKISQGYKGRDEFTVVENVLARRFPLAAPSEKSNTSTKKLRQIQYKLAPGEAGWVLKVDKFLDI